MRIYQSQKTSELLIGYEVFRCNDLIEVTLKESSWVTAGIEWLSLGILVETQYGYAGIFKSWNVLDRECTYIGEL